MRERHKLWKDSGGVGRKDPTEHNPVRSYSLLQCFLPWNCDYSNKLKEAKSHILGALAQPLTWTTTSTLTVMGAMFLNAAAFNQDVSSWDTT